VKRFVQALYRSAAGLLYHQFAWTYDLVAGLVSLGHWQSWVAVSTGFLEGRVLEIGFGPGHLQSRLLQARMPAFGIDESRAMARQARRKLLRSGLEPVLVRSRAEQLPFTAGAFTSVAATFPAEFIFDPACLAEIRRVLVEQGRLVILPAAWLTPPLPLQHLATRTQPRADRGDGVPPLGILRGGLEAQGFQVQSERVELGISQVLVIIANKRR
jgi:ubiquinone/menaquinone biosynthesis C-methylase UbiE